MLWWFAETTLVACVLAAVAAAASRVKSLGPAARHALWLVVLLKLVTPPLVESPWALPVGPAESAVRERPNVEVAKVESTAELPTFLDDWLDDVMNATPAGRSEGKTASAPRVVAFEESHVEPLSAFRAESIVPWCVGGWAVVSAAVAAWQTTRIVRFRRRLRGAAPAPDWLIDEVRRLAGSMGVRPPEALAVPGLGVPMVWCLGRPKLLLPAELLKTLGRGRWPAVLAHELAHLRRGDHWVNRVELAAGLVWWWNPVFWLARRRADAEAELACDAWVLGLRPGDRVAYARTMLEICESLSMRANGTRRGVAASAAAPPLAPALGGTGTARLFERRLTMILNDRVPFRLTAAGLIGPGLLVLIGLPTWTARATQTPAVAPAPRVDLAALVAQDEAKAQARSQVELERARAELAKAQADLAKAKLDAERREREANTIVKKLKDRQDAKAREEKEADDDLDKAKGKADIELKLKSLEKFFDADGDFVKGLEKLGPQIEKKLKEKFGDGSEFGEKMQKFGEKLGKDLGPGSDFEKAMKSLGKTLEEELGPGSDFEKAMKTLGKTLEEELGPGSEFEKTMKKFGAEMEARSKAEGEAGAKPKPKPEPKAKPAPRPKAEAKAKAKADESTRTRVRTRVRDQRAKALEEQIKALTKELERLKTAGDKEDAPDKG